MHCRRFRRATGGRRSDVSTAGRRESGIGDGLLGRVGLGRVLEIVAGHDEIRMREMSRLCARQCGSRLRAGIDKPGGCQ